MHGQSDHPRFQHINSTYALRELEWTLTECIQHVTEKGRFEARREHESYILVRERDGKLWQKHGSYYLQDEGGNLIVQPDPQSSRYGMTPQGVLQLCVLSSAPFRTVEEPLMADLRPAITLSRKKPRPCIDRPRLVEALADALFWYESSIHALEEQSTVQSRLDWSPITRLLFDHFDVIADDVDAALNRYRGKDSLPEGLDHDWLEGVLRVYPQLKTLSRKDIYKWLELAPAVAQLLQTVPGIAYAKLPWPNPPFSRSKIDIELGDLQRQILFDSYDNEVQKARKWAMKFDQEAQSILEQWRDEGILEHWLGRGQKAVIQEMTRIIWGNDSFSPARDEKRIPRREHFKGHLHALNLVLSQGTWPRRSLEDTPLYELLLLRMDDAFMRYGSFKPHNAFDYARVAILQQVGLEDLAEPHLIVDRIRQRLKRFEMKLQDALKAATDQRRTAT
jgi:hypothetical protein